MVQRRTLFDSSIGDVTLVDDPIGQNTPQAASFASVTVTGSVAVSGGIAVSGSMAVAGGLQISGSGNIVGSVVVGGLGVIESVNPSINLTVATSAFVSAVVLTAALNVVVSASFTSASPVALPSVATWIGGGITVLNQSTMTVGVWPQPLDIIDATATGAYVKIDAGKRSTFFAVSATGIISAQWGTTTV